MIVRSIRAIVLALCAALTGCATSGSPTDGQAARQEVFATERAFARTMAERNLAAFTGFLSDEAVFFSGPRPLHGKQEVIGFWTRFYTAPGAPFSWEPEEVEVLASGNLALSSGPVRDPQGKLIARFSSIWRLESGKWRIIFDKGSEVCNCATP